MLDLSWLRAEVADSYCADDGRPGIDPEVAVRLMLAGLLTDRLRERFPKLGALMDEAEDDVLAHMSFPKEHWAQIHSTNPLERLNGEIKRRTDVVAIFPNEVAIVRLVGALLLEQNDEWAVQRRYMSLETLEGLSDDPKAKPRRIAAA